MIFEGDILGGERHFQGNPTYRTGQYHDIIVYRDTYF